jgi:hypothetical protein
LIIKVKFHDAAKKYMKNKNNSEKIIKIIDKKLIVTVLKRTVSGLSRTTMAI